MSEADRCGDQSGRAVFRFSHFKNRRLTAETKKTKPNYNLQGQTILVISSKLKIVCHHLINFHHHAYPIFLNILNYLSIHLSIQPWINLAVFLSVNLSIDLFHSLNIITADPGVSIGLVVVVLVVGFFVWSMPSQLPPPCYPQFFNFLKISPYLTL